MNMNVNMNMKINNIHSNVYVYKESSARATALYEHIYRFNPGTNIFQIDTSNDADIGRLMHVFGDRDRYFDTNSNYFFILNEKGILEYNTGSNLLKKQDVLINVFPTLEQSQLETSKLYCREFISRVGLEYLNPEYAVLTKQTKLEMVKFTNRVIKADGLASGKGVFVYGDHFETDQEARDIVQRLLETHDKVLLEEKLEGEEFSCISLAWNGVITHFPLVRDFKRLEDGDRGPNTGGMGTISFSGGSMPFLSRDEHGHCLSINETVIVDTKYRGFLYGSFMKTRSGQIKIIEYNVRLGDSEAVNIFALLDSSLLNHLEDPIKYPLQINYKDHTFFRYLVPRDYARIHGTSGKPAIPAFRLGDNCDELQGLYTNTHYLVDANMPRESFYLANSHWSHCLGAGLHGLYSIGTSRACGILTVGCDIIKVIKENDRLVGMVYGDLYYRRDIGIKMLEMLETSNLQKNHSSKMNYLNHLNNYNHIITDIKKNIDQHNQEVELNNPDIKVLGHIGDFANSIGVGACRMICSVDGAGTKTKFLEGHPRRFDILGRDIVIHNINDMYCNNGRPVALLDYYGCDRLDKADFAQFINGALAVCREYGIALIGGETAEMRGIFQTGEVEVLGILLGILEDGKDTKNGDCIQAGHVIYGLESHGAHTNGFTKLREIESRMDCEGGGEDGNGMPHDIDEFFSQPHRCYIPVIESLKKMFATNYYENITITGKAHITGGGFVDNIERILPDGLTIALEKWPLTREWQWLFDNAGMDWDAFIRVFNAGWGFCLIVDKEIPESILADVVIGGLGKIKKIGKIVNK